MSNTHEFKVAMTCEGCSGAVERVLGKNKDKGIEKFEISLKDQSVKVMTAMSSAAVLELIKKTGKNVEFIKTV